jgi:hypothetical protein
MKTHYNFDELDEEIGYITSKCRMLVGEVKDSGDRILHLADDFTCASASDFYDVSEKHKEASIELLERIKTLTLYFSEHDADFRRFEEEQIAKQKNVPLDKWLTGEIKIQEIPSPDVAEEIKRQDLADEATGFDPNMFPYEEFRTIWKEIIPLTFGIQHIKQRYLDEKFELPGNIPGRKRCGIFSYTDDETQIFRENTEFRTLSPQQFSLMLGLLKKKDHRLSTIEISKIWWNNMPPEGDPQKTMNSQTSALRREIKTRDDRSDRLKVTEYSGIVYRLVID